MDSLSEDQSLLRPRRRARRLTPAERSAQLLECATRIFARRGIGEARHAEIAAEAKVAVATAFVYFPTREALVGAVLDEVQRFYIAMLTEVREASADAPNLLLKYVRAFADSVDSHPDYAHVFLEWSVAVRDEIWPRYLAFQRKVCAILEQAIRDGQRAGRLAREIDPEDGALLIMSAAHTVAQLKFTGCTPDRLERFLRALVRSAVARSCSTDSGTAT